MKGGIRMEPKFLRAEEVAQELSVSKPYAYKLIRQLNEHVLIAVLHQKSAGLARGAPDGCLVLHPQEHHPVEHANDWHHTQLIGTIKHPGQTSGISRL